MQIGILGTSVVAQTLGGKLSELGHGVMLGTRDVAATLARRGHDRYGRPPFSTWQEEHPAVKLGTFAEAAQHGEVVINATNGLVSLSVLQVAGSDHFTDKILIDVANPLDASRGMPPTLSVANTDSLAEQIQRAFPRAKVVKTLNTVTAALMVNPGLVANGDHTLFLSGNNEVAKRQVGDWLKEWFGWRDLIDLGDITSARGAEMYLPLWLRLWGALGTGMLNINVVR